MAFIKHFVNDMDESMIQRCLFCGEIISDYTNAIWPAGQDPPRGFASGEIFVSPGSPKITTTKVPQGVGIYNCKITGGTHNVPPAIAG